MTPAYIILVNATGFETIFLFPILRIEPAAQDPITLIVALAPSFIAPINHRRQFLVLFVLEASKITTNFRLKDGNRLLFSVIFFLFRRPSHTYWPHDGPVEQRKTERHITANITQQKGAKRANRTKWMF